MSTAAVVRVGMRTPWGTADSARVMADGIGTVSTPGHGGIKLAAARNRQVPAPLRREGGWYEEDCDALIPLYLFHGEIDGVRITRDEALAMMRRWFPEQVDAAFPELAAPVSLVKVRQVTHDDQGRVRVVEVPLAGSAADPERRALDTDRADDELIDGPEDDGGDRCPACKGLGLVRGIGKKAGGRYRTLAGAQAAQEAGRAVDCPTCEGAGLVGLALATA